MSRLSRALALGCALLAGCRDRRRARDVDPVAVDVAEVADASDDVTDVREVPWVGLTVRAVRGDAWRRGRDGAPKPLRVGDVLAPGDAASVRGDDAALKLATDDGGTLTSDGAVSLRAADWAGVTAVLLRGTLSLEPRPMAREALRVDTPGGRLATSSGHATVTVDDQVVRVRATSLGSVAWDARHRARVITPARPLRWTYASVTATSLTSALDAVTVDAGPAARDALTATLSLRWGRLVAQGPRDAEHDLAMTSPCDGCAPLRARLAPWIDAR